MRQAYDPPATFRRAAAVIHGLRNSAASVTLAIHSLAASEEIESEAGTIRLRIAKQELEAFQHLLDTLEQLFASAPVEEPPPATGGASPPGGAPVLAPPSPKPTP